MIPIYMKGRKHPFRGSRRLSETGDRKLRVESPKRKVIQVKGSGFKDVLSSTGNHSGQGERDVSV